MEEIWRPVAGYEDAYEVSNKGRVRSLSRRVASKNRWGDMVLQLPGKLLRPQTTAFGYLKVILSKHGKTTNKMVATLVAEAFIGSRLNGLLVLHNDGNAQNNFASNLRYGTQTENMQDSVKHGTRPRGRAHKFAKLTETQVHEIRASKDTNAALARRFGVDTSTVRLARIGRNWRHV